MGTLGLMWIVIAFVLALLWRRPPILLLTVAAALTADLLSDVGKALVHRHRPFVHQLGAPTTTHSFPSGHTATSFASALVLSSFAPRLRVLLYALAVLVAFSRLYNGDHFPLDVLGGAVLGTATALLLLAGFRRLSRRGSRAG